VVDEELNLRFSGSHRMRADRKFNPVSKTLELLMKIELTTFPLHGMLYRKSIPLKAQSLDIRQLCIIKDS
jgi:hypothetical protein